MLQPVQICFCDLVVLELICYRTRANQLINENNTTGWLEIKLDGKKVNFKNPFNWISRSSHIRVDLLLYELSLIHI